MNFEDMKIVMNDEYAENSRLMKRIVYSMNPYSFFSAFFATKLPGSGCVYVNQSLNFKRPVYIDDTVCKIIKKVVVDNTVELYLSEIK